MLNYKSWKFYFLIAVLLFVIASVCAPNLNSKIDLAKQGQSIEYQLITVNYIKSGRFPFVGLSDDLAMYNFDTVNRNWSLNVSTSIDMVKEISPVLDVAIPPGYPLFMIIMYKFFGYHISVIRLAQLFMVCFMAVFMTYLGIRLMGPVGVIAGVISGIIYFIGAFPAIYVVYPNILLSFLIFLCLLIYSTHPNSDSFGLNFSMGALLGLMMLTKGNAIFIPILFLSYTLYKSILKRQWRAFAFNITGMAILMLPWMAYANYMMAQTEQARANWKKEVLDKIKPVSVNKLSIPGANAHDDTLLMNIKVRTLSAKYADDGFVFLCKQGSWCLSDDLLSGHNELVMRDGSEHEEWPFIRKLYCNNFYTGKPVYIRIFHFYWDHPSYLFKIASAKFLKINTNLYKYYLNSILFLGLLIICHACVSLNKLWLGRTLVFSVLIFYFLLPGHLGVYIIFAMLFIYNIGILVLIEKLSVPVIMIISITNNALITLLFMGANRLAEIVDPVAVFSFFFLGYELIKQLARPTGDKPSARKSP